MGSAELATKHIPKEQVYAAIKCRRQWAGKHFIEGGSYQLGEVKKSDRCVSSDILKPYIDAAGDFVAWEIAKHAKGKAYKRLK